MPSVVLPPHRRTSNSLFRARTTPPRHPHSFPTRRSSDLSRLKISVNPANPPGPKSASGASPSAAAFKSQPAEKNFSPAPVIMARSEEHTSELQSRFDIVCRRLLEKTNKLAAMHTAARDQC